MTDATVNILGTQLPVAAFLVFLQDWLKQQSWFPMITYETERANRLFTIVATGLATVGIHMTLNTAGRSLTITWPTLSVLMVGVWHWVSQYVITKFSYLMLKNSLNQSAGVAKQATSDIGRKVGDASMKTIALVLCASLVLMGSTGCRHKVDTTNPVVVKAVTLQDAEKIVNTIAHGVKAADQVVDTTQASDPEYYAAVSPRLATLARLNEAANQCIVNAVRGGVCDWKAAIVVIAQKAGDPSSLVSFGFKNPNTQKEVLVGFAGLLSGIQLAEQFQQALANGGN